jgi:hypothetical protein
MTKSKMTWPERAAKAIAAVLKKYTDDGGDLVYLSEADRKLLKKQIDAAYPFYERRCYPYKAWLQERRRVFMALGIPIVSRRHNQPESNQLSLFSTQSKRKK